MGCGFNNWEDFVYDIGEEGAKLLHLNEMTNSRMLNTGTKWWKSLSKKKKEEVVDNGEDVGERMLWIKDHVGFGMSNMIIQGWKYMKADNMLPKGFTIPQEYLVELDAKDDNTVTIHMSVGEKTGTASQPITCKTFIGDLTKTAGNWEPNNFTKMLIRAFFFSLAYGLRMHPEDDQATTEDDVRAIIGNLSALTSLDTYWVVMFCLETAVEMVKSVMKEHKNLREDSLQMVVSHFFQSFFVDNFVFRKVQLNKIYTMSICHF